MGGKTAIALGLVAGIAAGGLLVGGLLALTPGPEPYRDPDGRAGRNAVRAPVGRPFCSPICPVCSPVRPVERGAVATFARRAAPVGPRPGDQLAGPSASTVGEALGLSAMGGWAGSIRT